VEANKVTLQPAATIKNKVLCFFFLFLARRPSSCAARGIPGPSTPKKQTPNPRTTHRHLPFSTYRAVPLFSENNNENYEYLIRWRSGFNKQNKDWGETNGEYTQIHFFVEFQFFFSFPYCCYRLMCKQVNNFQSAVGISHRYRFAVIIILGLQVKIYLICKGLRGLAGLSIWKGSWENHKVLRLLAKIMR